MSWQIELDETGRVLELVVNEQRISPTLAGIEGAVIAAEPGSPTALTVFVRDAVKILGVGPVSAVAVPSARMGVLAWLDSLDADALEKMALESMGGFGGAHTTGAAFLAALRQNAEQLT